MPDYLKNPPKPWLLLDSIEDGLPLSSKGRVAKAYRAKRSWYCDQCSVEVYQLRCPHCGKTKRGGA